MMVMMAQTNPEILERLGQSSEIIFEELRRLERFNKMKKMTQEEKSRHDVEMWIQWISLYKKRLAVELEGIEDQQVIQQMNVERAILMNSNNPKFILRNYMAQQAIASAEKGDYSEVQSLHALLKAGTS